MQLWKVKALTYLSGIYLYRWYAVGFAWVVCWIGWGAVAALPDQYTAEAKVYIDTENLMDPLLRGMTISVDPAQEISVMLRTLITRPTLQQVISLTNPGADTLTPAQREQQVTTLQNRISIRQLETRNYFAIGYTDNNSNYAASVTQTLLSILQDSRVGNTRLDMDSARSFINKQIDEYETRLRDADKRRADFRTVNIEILSKGTAANRIDTADAAYLQAQRDLDFLIAKRDSTAKQFAATPATLGVDQRMFPMAIPTTAVMEPAAANVMRPATGPAGAPPASDPLRRKQQAQAAMEELRTRYTEEHPDVLAQKRLIAQIDAQLALEDEAAPATPVMIPNPLYAQLQAKVFEEDTDVAVQRQRVAAANAELIKAKTDASRAVDILAQFNGLDRDYANIEATYKGLLQSRESASLSQARDDQNQGISFRVLDPAQEPQFPTAPNRLLFNSVVLLLGVGAGAALAVLLTLNAGRFITSEDLASQFGLPIIGVITALPGIPSRRSRLSILALSTSVGLLLLSYVGVATIMRTSIYSVLGV